MMEVAKPMIVIHLSLSAFKILQLIPSLNSVYKVIVLLLYADQNEIFFTWITKLPIKYFHLTISSCQGI